MANPKPYQPYQFYHSRIGNRHLAKADLLRDLEPSLDLLERQIDPLSSPTVLPFLDDNDLPDKVIKYAHPNSYYLDRSSTAIPDGVNVVATATNNGRWVLTSGSGITAPEHEFLRTLTHSVVEDAYTEITRVSGQVTNIIVWTSPAKTSKIREAAISRSSGQVSMVTEKQYDSSGALSYTLVHNFTRSSGQVTNYTTTRI